MSSPSSPLPSSGSSQSAFYDSLLARSVETPAKIRPSASVIPWRLDASGDIEVWWVRRAPTMRFMAGFWAFPGGGISRKDVEIRVSGSPPGTSHDTHTDASPELDDAQRKALGPDLIPGLVGGTLRELFEETGLFLRPSEAPSPSATSSGAVREDRNRLLRKEVSFADLTERYGAVDASRLVFAGRWLTPPFVPMRFDNRFFLLQWPDEAGDPDLADESVDGVRSEHDRSEWIRPSRALARWRESGLLTAPPILHILKVLAEEGLSEGGSVKDRALERLRDTREANLGPMRRIEFQPGIVLLPLRTPTLPPASRTNAFLLGNPPGAAVLVDPATPLPDEQDRLLRALDAAREQGFEIGSIWLTHHHPDHVGAVEAVWKHLGEPLICAHAADAAALEQRGILVDEELENGQDVRFEGEPDLDLRVFHTPGHTRGHLSFYVPSLGTLLAGDLTSTLSTIIIDPPDGDMDLYLASLRRMALMKPRVLYPSHGPLHTHPRKHLEDLVKHRLEREEKILDAWNDGLTTASAMVARVYDDVPAELHPVAQRQIEAHLVRLRRSGVIPRY